MGGELRKLIEEMVHNLDENPPENYPARLQEIAHVSPHTILPLSSVEPLQRYNCVMHALGLVGNMGGYEHPLLVAKTPFVKYLITNALQPSEPKIDALVVWSSSGGIQHIGKLIAPDRAESKWGAGLLCSHGLDEIPQRYGEVSGFYGPIDSDSVLEHLNRFIFET